MKHSELWQSYVDYTKSVTESARKLGFAAAAICWFFKNPDNTFPVPILRALGATVLYFILDMLQFILGAVLLRVWTRREEKAKWKMTGSLEGEYDKPAWLDTPSYILWWLKVLCLLLAFLLIGKYLVQRS